MSARKLAAATRVLEVSITYLEGFDAPGKGRAGMLEEAREITPEEAIANYQLILDEPMLALTVRRGALSIEDMADIADYIRLVQAERPDQEEGNENGQTKE